MAKLSKRMKALKGSVDRTRLYPVSEALTLVKKNANAKFDESIDVAVNLGIDARKSDQLVRGSVVLPRGTGKSVRVAVFAQGDNAKAAKDANNAKTRSIPIICFICVPPRSRWFVIFLLPGVLKSNQKFSLRSIDSGDIIRTG